MDLSDALVVVAVVRSGLSGDDRADRWPIVFTRKGLRAAYIHKGQPAKGGENSQVTRYVSDIRRDEYGWTENMLVLGEAPIGKVSSKNRIKDKRRDVFH